jgi:hypothetical protein
MCCGEPDGHPRKERFMSFALDTVVLATAEALVDYYNPLRAQNGLEPAVVDDRALAHARHIVERITDTGLVSVPFVEDVAV